LALKTTISTKQGAEKLLFDLAEGPSRGLTVAKFNHPFFEGFGARKPQIIFFVIVKLLEPLRPGVVASAPFGPCLVSYCQPVIEDPTTDLPNSNFLIVFTHAATIL